MLYYLNTAYASEIATSVLPGLESCSSRCIWFCNPSSRLQPHSGCNKLDLITANHWNRIHNLNLRSPLIWLKDSGASNFLTLVLPELCLGVTKKWLGFSTLPFLPSFELSFPSWCICNGIFAPCNRELDHFLGGWRRPSLKISEAYLIQVATSSEGSKIISRR